MRYVPEDEMIGRKPAIRCSNTHSGNQCVYDSSHVNIYGYLGDEHYRVYTELSPGPFRYILMCDAHTDYIREVDADWVNRGEEYEQNRWDNYPELVLFEYDSEGWWQLAAAFAILAEFSRHGFGGSERFTEVEVRLAELGMERLTASMESNREW